MSANQQPAGSTIEAVRGAKARAHETFAKLGKVVGVGITRIGEGYGVKLNLEAPPAPDANLPENVDGVPIRIEVVGTTRKR